MSHTEQTPSTAPPPRPLTDHPKVAETLAEVLEAHTHALRNIDRMLADMVSHPMLLSDASLGEEIAYARRHTMRAADCLGAASADYRAKAGS
jgi:hypothetical protein